MLGISNSIFSEASGLVKDWLKNPLNASFFYWYFLPAVGFVILQVFFIGPLRGHRPPPIFALNVGRATSFADLILRILSHGGFILIPLIIAVLLSALAGTILRLYQGNLPLISALFRPALMRNRQRSTELYSRLAEKRRAYFFLISQGVQLQTTEGNEVAKTIPESERNKLIEQLKAEIQAIHETLEQAPAARELPIDPDRVGATRLANSLAVAEEYPFERYSVDTAVFWPRLAAEIEPEKLETLTATFGAMNGLLNLSLLSYLAAAECIVVTVLAVRSPAQNASIPRVWLALAIPAALLAGFAFYRAALRAARSVGNELRTAFDYYRGRVLQRFNLIMPKDIEEERVVWLKLGAFIRRGESFYYPSEYRD